jgi:GNAT superfamily N-acetyltransferase
MNPKNKLSIRSMLPADLVFAAACTAQEEWVSENLAAFEVFFEHDPVGCLIAEEDGVGVGICVATPYAAFPGAVCAGKRPGEDCAAGFIGELIVREEARGHGVGAALLGHAAAYLRGKGARTVYLDGVVQAVPLYERNGFRKVCRALRYSGRVAARQVEGVRLMQSGDLPRVFDLDRRMFGVDRSFFLARRLRLFPQLCRVMFRSPHSGGDTEQLMGFIQGRCGEDWISCGPWVVAEDAPYPQHLLESIAVEAGGEPIHIAVLESSRACVALLNQLGFTSRETSPWRMVCETGAQDDCHDLGAAQGCYAIGSGAKG